MKHKKLKNKPLVEAIFEVRWKLQPQKQGLKADPHYSLFLGRLFDRISGEFPEHEQLPAAVVPDAMVAHTVQHRFRRSQGQWPLVQVGPGIQTYNATEDYTWEAFRPGTVDLMNRVFESYPKPDDLVAESLILRYIDAVQFDYNKENAFDFLRKYMQLKLELPKGLFADHSVESKPKTLSWETTFESEQPAGRLKLRFASGQTNNSPSIVWETTFQSSGHDVPKVPEDFESWLDGAHDIIIDCFFKLIEGELEGRFSGD